VAADVSRRRRPPGSTRKRKDWIDVDAKRLKLVCTGGGRHGVVVLDEYWREDDPYRPDRSSAVNRTARSAQFAEGGLPRCGRCPDSVERVFDETMQSAVHAALESAAPGRALRFDVSTGRLLI
jgi:hypothetical protein